MLLKGMLDLCVLALLDEDEVYGYELTTLMRERGIDVSGGSVYPLLARLEQAGDVQSEARPSASGPPRRYWRLTTAGRRTLVEGRAEWNRLVTAVAPLLQPGSESFTLRGSSA